MSAQFTGAVKALSKRAIERSAKYSNNIFVDKLLRFQRTLSDKVESLESLHENRKPGENEEEQLRFAKKFKNELPKILDDLKKVGGEIESSMLAGAYEHSKLQRNEFDVEIRSYVRSMSFADRISFIISAFKNGDAKVLGSLLHDSVPAVLVGIDTKTQTKYRDDFFKFVIPEFMEAWEGYRDLSEHVSTTFQVAREVVEIYSDEAKLASIDRKQTMYSEAKTKLEIM